MYYYKCSFNSGINFCYTLSNAKHFQIYVIGVASSSLLFSSMLRLSFLLCNNVTYRRIIWQSMNGFYFLCQTSIFGNITKAIVHGLSKNGISRYETESNYFMLEFTSICPVTT